jgi:hypothetical protein
MLKTNLVGNAMNTCPCCSEQLLRHARSNTIYWFCSRCRQEMPNLSDSILPAHENPDPMNLWMVESFDLAHRV